MSQPLNQTVLVIDDSPDIHDLVGARLRNESISLLRAEDAEAGERRIREERPDLILLDLDLPGTDGMTLCRRIKADHELIDIPVIFLTGTMDTTTKVEAFDLGAVDYVTKPFDPVELRARVRSALRTKRYHDLLTTTARIDALTGLWNRGYFDDQLAAEIALLQRGGGPAALAMIDIDHFKPINDTHGHPFGDSVIQRVAAALKQMSRTGDVVCRYGGEEFAVILRDTPAPGAATLAERMRRAMAELEVAASNQPVPITASIGIAGSDDFAEPATLTAERFLAAADQALYRAKANGRNRVERIGG